MRFCKVVPMMVTVIAIGVLPVASAQAGGFDEFGFESAAAEVSTPLAGAHPDMEINVGLNHYEVGGEPKANARLEDMTVELPPGLTGDPTVALRCATGAFLAMGNCPVGSQVGIAKVLVSDLGGEWTEPIYNLEPPHGRDAVARLGFVAALYPTFIDISVRTGGDYGVTATIHDASGQGPLLHAETILWGVPAAASHDRQRLTPTEAWECEGGMACKAPKGKRSSGLPLKPFLTNATACQQQNLFFAATSYQLPGQTFTAQAPLAPTTDCEALQFPATVDVQPNSHTAGSPTGVKTMLRIPQNEDPNSTAPSAMRAASVTLPPGMTLSASAADGLEACSSEQVGLGREEVASACPNASKLATATITSPALQESLPGAVYLRTPEPGHLFRVWLVTDEFGLHIKLPGEINPDPQTGQITAEFRETPQLPVEEIALDFKDGPRAGLKNPDSCGTYATSYDLTPWSGGAHAVGQSQMTIDQACGAGFTPKLEAGVTKPKAGAFSPLIVTLDRQDAEGNIDSFSVKLPQGELAKLAGVPVCAEDLAGSAACPADTQIGTVAVAVGAGSQPLWFPRPGQPALGAYLAGPYKGAPYSLVTKVPAQAGPFDLGTVVVRSGIYIAPQSGQAIVKTELPQILEGVPILYRTIHATIDRPNFALNPTDCRKMKVKATVISPQGAVAQPSDRFQVGGCQRFGFRPKLSLALSGGTKRGAYPALTARLRTRKKDANIDQVSVALPHSEFLAQEHIGTICTRVQFKADACPAGSIYGYARATTPLLDQPLEGPVYLRSSNHPLPDLVVALRGQIEIDLVGRIDSVNGGLRTTFGTVPDAPVSKFVLEMKGGKKGLLVNSVNTCRDRAHAVVKMDAQNGRRRYFDPRLHRRCG